MIIGLKKLRIDCIIGCKKHERASLQPLFIDLECIVLPPKNDALHETVDYEAIATLLQNIATTKKFQLLESFAKVAVDAIIDGFSAISSVKIRIEKPQALENAAYSFVEFERKRT